MSDDEEAALVAEMQALLDWNSDDWKPDDVEAAPVPPAAPVPHAAPVLPRETKRRYSASPEPGAAGSAKKGRKLQRKKISSSDEEDEDRKSVV